MTLTALPPLDPTSPTFRTDVDTFFSSRIQNFVSEANQLAANLNSIAAGGAYAIPYKFSSETIVSNPGWYFLRLNAIAQNSSNALLVSAVAANTADMTGILGLFNSSGSAVKGSLRLQKQGDASKWLTFDLTAISDPGGYRDIAVVCTGYSDVSPFTDGDAVMLYFQRTGDKGDTGPAYIPQAVKFSDRKASGTAGGSAVAGDATQVRTLNTTDYNTIPSGVSLSGNQVTLPAGTYDFWGRAPAWGVGNHKASLYNVTDGQIALAGSSTYASGGQASYADQTESFFSGRITLSAPKTFVVRHYTQNIGGTNALGCATSVSGQLETYTEVNVTKIA